MARYGVELVADVVKYETDIKGKKFVRLVAGVGSGKNYWVLKLKEQYPDMRILFVTSRANVANAQALKMDASRFIDIQKLIDDDNWGDPAYYATKIVVCTNAGISTFFKETFDMENSRTHLWRKFDLIVVDEAHSLVTDATFTEGPFYISELLKYIYKEDIDCDIVLMTGTPYPMDMLFGKTVEQMHTIDIFEKCVHLVPDYVRLVPNEDVLSHIVAEWKRGHRMIYFSNHRSTIGQLVTELIKEGIPIKAFGFSFNYDEDKVGSFPEELQANLKDKLQEMNEHLVKEESVPEDVKILFSTSKNKEGISINDDNFQTIFAEAHMKADLIQMAGRVRGNPKTGTGIKHLAVVYDAKQHSSNYWKFEEDLCGNCCDNVNATMADYLERIDDEVAKKHHIKKIIKSVEERFRYLKYNPITQKFQIYKGKIIGDKLKLHEANEFFQYIRDWDRPYFDYDMCGLDALQDFWFPNSKVLYYLYVNKEEEAKKALETFLTEKAFLDATIKREDKMEVEEELARISEQYCLNQIFIPGHSRLKSHIEKLGFTIKDKSHGKTYKITKL